MFLHCSLYLLIIFKNSASVNTGTPKAFAFVSLLPASRPAKTNEVFLETEDDALPPNSSIKLFASSLERESSVPVTTMVRPSMARTMPI